MRALSVVVICNNEERNIGRCLQSVQGLAGEIVVVDSGSTDRTEEICRQYGARFTYHAFEGHIQQKNYAASLAKNDWVLSLDADEALSPELYSSIKNFLENSEEKTSLPRAERGYSLNEGDILNSPPLYGRGGGGVRLAFKMNRLTNYCGRWVRHCGWYPDTKLRLFNRHYGKWGGVNPHDKYELDDKNAPVGFLQGDILHYSFYTVDEHYKQTRYFSAIAAKAHFARGKRAYWFNLIINPTVKFIRDYFIKLGFLDGATGFTISRIQAWGNYLKYKQIWELGRNKK